MYLYFVQLTGKVLYVLLVLSYILLADFVQHEALPKFIVEVEVFVEGLALRGGLIEVLADE